jgi:hypothetical protein
MAAGLLAVRQTQRQRDAVSQRLGQSSSSKYAFAATADIGVKADFMIGNSECLHQETVVG